MNIFFSSLTTFTSSNVIVFSERTIVPKSFIAALSNDFFFKASLRS